MRPRALIHCRVFLACGCGELSGRASTSISPGSTCCPDHVRPKCNGRGTGRNGTGRTIQNLNPLTLKRPPTALAIPIAIRTTLPRRPRPRHVRHGSFVRDQLLTPTALAHETHGDGEDGLAALAGLDGAGGEALALAHVLDVVQDGDLRVTGQHEVAVHRVHGEVRGYGALRRRQALRDHRPAVDAARPRGVPEWSGVGEDVLLGGGGELGRLLAG